MEDDKPKVYFMSRPGTPVDARRSYLVKCADEPNALVRIYPGLKSGDGISRRFVCDCPDAFRPAEPCRHVAAVAIADNRRYQNTKGEN